MDTNLKSQIQLTEKNFAYHIRIGQLRKLICDK